MPPENPGNDFKNIINSEELLERLEQQSATADRTGEELQRRYNLESSPVNDFVRYLDSEELGAVEIILRSDDALEFDLLTMETSEGVLSIEEISDVLQNGFEKTVKLVGDYLSPKILQKVFPGLDTKHPDSYDYKRGKTHFFVLTEEDYEYFYSSYRPYSKRVLGGFTRLDIKKESDPNFNQRYLVNLSERSLVVIKGNAPLVLPEGEEPDSKVVNEHKKKVSKHLEHVFEHELLHLLGVGEDLGLLEEGLVEWYARRISLGRVLQVKDFEATSLIKVGYGALTKGVTIIFEELLTHGGFRETDLHEAFLREDASKINEVMGYLTNRIGEQTIDQIVNFRFKDDVEFLATVENAFGQGNQQSAKL